MAYLGDYRTTDTLYSAFATVNTSGVPTTLSGTPKLRVYKSGSTTESSDITPTVDFDSRTGLNAYSIDLTGDTGFYATAKDYQVVITAGTVGGVSVVGVVVDKFSVENRSAVMSATAGRKLVVDAAGLADANVVKLGPTGSGTAQTARDVGASVLLSTGSGAGQLDFTSGVVKANVTQFNASNATSSSGRPEVNVTHWLGTAASTPTVAGVPNVNAKTWNDLTTVALPLVPTTAGRTLDVSAGGEAGLDWANVGSPTTSLDLSNTTIKTTQKVDVDTIKTNPVVNGGTITFPTTATLASTTNITAGTVTTATNVTTVNGIAANVITATSIATDAITAAKIATDAIGASELAADAVTEIQSGLSTLTQANVRTAVGLASANLDTQLAKADLSATIPDSIPADGTRPSVQQAAYMLCQFMLERAVSSTTVTVKKADGSTSLFTLTLDSGTSPTSITRAT